MRIKFLSFIASFFIASFVITSCLDEENHIEYSSDATIHAFSLDTIGYGKTYKFTIDQLKGEIYNEDSLPVHADTIIDRILIKKLTTASGIVTVKDKNNQDSIINLNDSVDLRKPLKIKVWSADGFANFDNTKTKDYTITVRIHKYDPDSLKWNNCGSISNDMTDKQKSIRLGNKTFTYTMQGSELKVYTSENMSVWTAHAVTGMNQLPTSILPLKNSLIATANHTIYTSTDGLTWTAFNKIQGNVLSLVSLLPVGEDMQITYLKEEGKEKAIYTLTEADLAGTAEEIAAKEAKGKFVLNSEDTDHATFPVSHFTYATFPKAKGYMNIVMGKHEPAIKTTVNGKEVSAAVAWGYDGHTWARLGTTSSVSYCPAYENPTLMYYNEKLYYWGEGFEAIYESNSEGFAWKKAPQKFVFPTHNWKKSSIQNSTKEQPEFRGRVNYSVIQDTEKHNIYLLFGKEANVSFKEEVSKKDGDKVTTTTETRTYNHESEVWCGRLNQLWFDLANAGK